MLHEDAVECSTCMICSWGKADEKVGKNNMLHGCGFYDGSVALRGYFLIVRVSVPEFHALNMRSCV